MEKLPLLTNKFMINAPPDLCLITNLNGTKKFYVHKIILMCISPYFEKAIHYKESYKNNQVQKIKDEIDNKSKLNNQKQLKDKEKLNVFNDQLQELEFLCKTQDLKKKKKIHQSDNDNISGNKINSIENEVQLKNIEVHLKEDNKIQDEVYSKENNFNTADENSLKNQLNDEINKKIRNDKLIYKIDNEDKFLVKSENKTNKVLSNLDKDIITLKFPDIDHRILGLIIKYAYIGKIKINEDNVQDLIITCDMLNIPVLIDQCIDFFFQNLTTINCVGIWIFSNRFSFEKLSFFSKRFVLRNFEQVFEKSEEFLNLLSFKEFSELLENNLLFVSDEYLVFKSIIKWISFNLNERKIYLVDLIQKIRLGLISYDTLSSQVMLNSLVTTDFKVKKILVDVQKSIKYLNLWGKPNSKMLNTSIRKYLVPRYPIEFIFVFGGRSLNDDFIKPEPLFEVYDHCAERWKIIEFSEDKKGLRDHHHCIALKTNIYVLGGHCGIFEVYNSCRKFNLITKQWSEIAPMKEIRTFFACVAIDETIYAIGGYNGSWRVDTVEKYTVSLNQWHQVSSMNERRSGAGAAVLNKKIYVVGGFRELTYLRCAEFYDPLTDVWTNIALMLKPRSNPSVVALGGFIYVIGGLSNHKLLSSVEKYNAITNKWKILDEEMIQKKCSASAVVLDDKIFVIGGWNGDTGLETVEIYCSKTKKWYQGSKLNKKRTGLSACLVKDIPNLELYAWDNRENLIEERFNNANEIEKKKFILK